MKPKTKEPKPAWQPPVTLAVPQSAGRKGWISIGPGCYVRSVYTDQQD